MLYTGASFDMMRPAYRDSAYAAKVAREAGQLPGSLKFVKSTNFVVGFPSGQREQTVNLPSQTSKVRILPPPPSLQSSQRIPASQKPHNSPHRGRMRSFDKVRVERSETTRFSAARRVRSVATNNPSPTTISSKLLTHTSVSKAT